MTFNLEAWSPVLIFAILLIVVIILLYNEVSQGKRSCAFISLAIVGAVIIYSILSAIIDSHIHPNPKILDAAQLAQTTDIVIASYAANPQINVGNINALEILLSEEGEGYEKTIEDQEELVYALTNLGVVTLHNALLESEQVNLISINQLLGNSYYISMRSEPTIDIPKLVSGYPELIVLSTDDQSTISQIIIEMNSDAALLVESSYNVTFFRVPFIKTRWDLTTNTTFSLYGPSGDAIWIYNTSAGSGLLMDTKDLEPIFEASVLLIEEDFIQKLSSSIQEARENLP